MSVFEKITDIHSAVENFIKEKPIVAIESNVSVVVENYLTIRYFCCESIIIVFDNFELSIFGNELSIEYFSPMKILIKGTVLKLEYNNMTEGKIDN